MSTQFDRLRELEAKARDIPGGSFPRSTLAANYLNAAGLLAHDRIGEAARYIERETRANSLPEILDALPVIRDSHTALYEALEAIVANPDMADGEEPRRLIAVARQALLDTQSAAQAEELARLERNWKFQRDRNDNIVSGWGEQVIKLQQQVKTQSARITQLEAALREAAQTFRQYATMHLSKSPPHVTKAAVNTRYAELLEALLP